MKRPERVWRDWVAFRVRRIAREGGWRTWLSTRPPGSTTSTVGAFSRSRIER
jgi:hypothetical protein